MSDRYQSRLVSACGLNVLLESLASDSPHRNLYLTTPSFSHRLPYPVTAHSTAVTAYCLLSCFD
jgi:hypothetical protein